MAYDFYMPARVVGGEGVVLAQSALVSRFGKKCVIVTGGTGAVKSGALADTEKALVKENIEYKIYNKNGGCVDHCDPYGFGMEVRPNTASIIRDLDKYKFNDDEWIKRRSDCKSNYNFL